jgi:hypothetical protein
MEKTCTGRPKSVSICNLIASPTIRGSRSSSSLVKIMRPSNTPLLSRTREDDRSEPQFVLTWAPRLGDGWSLRRCFRQFRWLSTRFAALWTVLWFCGLIATSGPHLVHHLTDLQRPHDHHSQADQPRLPDCFIFSLMQHTPVAEGVLSSLSTPLAVGGSAVVEPPLTVREEPWSIFLARAPPV